MEEERFCPLTNNDLTGKLFTELSSQRQHHQQECPHEFDDSDSKKDDNCYASVNNEPKHESLLSMQPLIDNYETANNKHVTLDHDATQIVDNEDNDDNNNNDDHDEAISNTIAASCPNMQAECVTLKRSMKISEKVNSEQISADRQT